jgi:Fur family ferric uptake transcriptional regulator
LSIDRALLHLVAIATDHDKTGIVAAMSTSDMWTSVPERMRARGMRWTPQRRLLLRVLADTKGHVTASELLDRCRAMDPQTTPSTVYRTLDVLEELGVVRHAHGADGREEFHVLPKNEHGHLTCTSCGRTWEIDAAEAGQLTRALIDSHAFEVDLSHLTIVGHCAACRAASAGS